MRIAIDAHMANTELAGSVTFITETIEALAKIDRKSSYTIYITERKAHDLYEGRWPNFRVRRVPYDTLVLDRLFSYATQLRLHPVDLLFTQFVVPRFCPCPVVTLVPDLAFDHVPDAFEPSALSGIKRNIRRWIENAVHIVTPSDFTRNDLIENYQVDESKVTNIPHGASDRFYPVVDKEQLKAVRVKFGLDDEFILTVGTVQPRKNLARLLEAYAGLKKLNGRVPQLVLVGKYGWQFDELLGKAASLGIVEDMRFTGFVPDDELPALYSAARFFVYPSYFEGFGLPPLEAMKCGTPVITGNATSLPEVVGDAGIMVDPFDTEAMMSALRSMNERDDLRSELSRKGIERAQMFSWEDAAQKTLDVFERVTRK